MENKHQFKFLSLFLFVAYLGFSQNVIDTFYGDNAKVGKYVNLNGTRLYYEEYGKGEPLLIIHSCGTDIKAMEYQIDYFKNDYRVIAADSRGQGKSELNSKTLTYDLMASDLEALVKHLKIDSLNILGWSDGGIIAFKMGINNNVNIKKIAAMGVNLRPDTTAINKWAYDQVREMRDNTRKMISLKDTSRDWKKELLLDELLVTQPNITHQDLKRIKVPVLVLIGDRDIIKNEHALEIFNNLPKPQLCIMPGTHHGAPRHNSKIFNEIAERFFVKSFDYSQDN